MRLVKRSVNQDDPGTYHLFYADAEGHAGTDLTFFPWAHMAPSRDGHGLATEVSLAVPADTLDWWGARLTGYGATVAAIETRFGERVLPIVDPHGLRVALVETAPAVGRGFTPWDDSPVPPERQIRGLHGARVVERDTAATVALLTGALGFVAQATEGDWQRFVIPDPAIGDRLASSGGLLSGVSGRHLDVCARPDARRGAWGTGSIHHLAWRVDDDAHEAEMRRRVDERRRASDAGDRSLLVQVGLFQGARRRALRAGDRRPRLRRRRGGARARRIAGAAAVARDTAQPDPGDPAGAVVSAGAAGARGAA